MQRHAQGCLATRQVQRSDEDPTVFEVTYRGRHTCALSRMIETVKELKMGKEIAKKLALYLSSSPCHEFLMKILASYEGSLSLLESFGIVERSVYSDQELEDQEHLSLISRRR